MAVNQDQNASSMSAQDQTLLKALQDLIVWVMDPMQNNDINMHLGPEAGKLIAALQDFISSIVVRSRSEVRNAAIDVSLVEEGNGPKAGNADENGEGDESLLKGGLLPETYSPHSDGSAIEDNNVGDLGLEKPQPTFEEKLLRAVREHVFNMMPIRLLCFEPNGESSFRISLIERGAIYARLVSVLNGKMRKKEFRLQLNQLQDKAEHRFIAQLVSEYTRYAILSHTWLRTASGEVTYDNWNKGLLDPQNYGYRKLVSFCKTAWKDHGLAFGWMDTVCINKESSSELDESIRSMFNWYSRAAVCIVYLAETGALLNMHMDPWFTHGWTLQELLAPSVIKFYNRSWQRLVNFSDNDKGHAGITERIERATTISENELWDIRRAPISRRMQLAATRQVTREEDTAYSLMGIFDISISTAYGEGAPRAFFRLLHEILLSSKYDVLEVLNWAGELPFSRPYTSRILPTSPKSYINRSSNKHLKLRWPIEPLTFTHWGLRVPLILMPGISIPDTTSQHHPIGDYSSTVHISPCTGYYHKDIPTTYNLLDNRIFGADGWKTGVDSYQMTFAVFNFKDAPNDILLPKTCIAIGLACRQAAGEVSTSGNFGIIRTNEPIVFELSRRTPGDEKSSDDFWHIKQDELAQHGMQSINLYL